MQNQGQCGSCWSFAVAHTVSDAFSIMKAKANSVSTCDKYANLSEEELIWCSGATPDGNCNGGYIHTALEYVAQKGLGTDLCTPYGHGSGSDSLGYGGCPSTCQGTGSFSNKVTSTASSYTWLDTTAKVQQYLVNYGPATVGMPVYTHMYGITDGVYKPQANQEYAGGHAIEVVGWGKEQDGEGYWIMKNSWGCNWGDSGFFKQGWG